MAKYFLNPEFHRNLWIEFTKLRLIAMPVLLGLGCYVFAEVQGDPYLQLCKMSVLFFFVVVAIWGSHTASSTLQDEVRNNVWDFQRTSSLAPARYAFGKLFGATAYVWYFALALWVIFAVSAFNVSAPALPPGLRMPGGLSAQDIPVDPGERFKNIAYTSAFLFLGGLFGQTTAFMAGCHALFSTTRQRKVARWRANMGGLLAGMAAASAVYGLLVSPFFNLIVHEGSLSFADKLQNTYRSWYGFSLSALEITTVTVLFFLFWEMTAVWRMMKQALLYRTWPLAWPLFTLALLAYVGGFANNVPQGLKITLTLSLVLAYFVMAGDAADPSKYRRFAAGLKLKDKLRMLENAPAWSLAALFPLALLPALVLAAAQSYSWSYATNLGVGFLSAALFIARDSLVLHAIFWTGKLRHARFAVIAYYAIAYILLPAIFIDHASSLSLGGLNDEKAVSPFLSKDQVAAFFIPSSLGSWWLSLLAPLGEAVLAACLLRRLMKK